MIIQWRNRHLGLLFEGVLIGLGAMLLYVHPLAMNAELWLVMLFAVPLMALAIIFPVTLPSLFVSLELVFTFYFVLGYDVTTTLWVNAVAELAGGLYQISRARMLYVLLNPMLKVICLAGAFSAYEPVERLLTSFGAASALLPVKLFTVALVFFLLNHLLLHLNLYLHSGHFRLKSVLNAVKWESFVYLVVIPFAYLGCMIKPHAEEYTLLLLGIPVAIVTYLIRVFNHLQWSSRVNQACVRMSTTTDFKAIYQKTFQLAQEMTDSPHALLLKRMADGTFQGIDADGTVYDQINDPLLDIAVSERDVRMITSAKVTSRIVPGWETRSLMLVPLVGKTEVFGVICLGKGSSYGFNKGHQSQLRFLAHQVSIILDRNHVYEALERAAITNQLTGLYNYQYFYEQLYQRFHLAQETGEELSLFIFDIDHFKKYNDIYGHIVGDEVLRQVATIAKRVTESRNILLARYGGEEFVAIGRMTTSEAYELAEEVRRELEIYQFVYQEHTVKNITISVGIASLREHGAGCPNELLEQADQALYWGGKELGRNRVAVYAADFDQRLFVDSLTGLHTTHYLKRKLHALCEQAGNFPMHFLLVDIPELRRISEQWGLDFANKVLVDASYVLKSTMRGDDLICRYQDDEFLVVVKGIPEADLDAVAKRIRAAFSKHLFPVVGTTVTADVTHVTLSGPEEEGHVWEWLERLRPHYRKKAN